MDKDTAAFIKIVVSLALAVFVPLSGLFFVYYKNSLYRYWNKLDRFYRKLRRNFHV
jgi:hypothetical protein